MMSLPAFQEWTRAGLAETLVIERFDKYKPPRALAPPGAGRVPAAATPAGL